MKKLTAIILLMVFVLAACSNAAEESAETTPIMPPTPLMLVNYNQQTGISSQEISSYINQEGNTVAFYGKNLDVDEIVESYFSDPEIFKQKDTSTCTPAVYTEDGRTFPATQAYYAVIATNWSNHITLSYYSFSYPPEAEDDMDSYYKEALSIDNITNLANTFAFEKKQQELSSSILTLIIKV